MSGDTYQALVSVLEFGATGDGSNYCRIFDLAIDGNKNHFTHQGG